ncbi:MAG: pyridoxal-phosphate dependent enzyme [Gammaproteobacteria bacterium]|nr:MAG: pyridoxal-phosphate dependent enzyme [Gammaproteobacteria bacterium]
MSEYPDIQAVRKAYQQIKPYIHVTPVMHSQSLDDLSGCQVIFKCENFQRTGAFKMRGAMNAVLNLPDTEAGNGVITHSSGNHAAALARAAGIDGIPCHIVMPDDAPSIKQSAVTAYGAKITFCEPSMSARETTVNRLIDEIGMHLVHPYDDHDVIAGQGTVTLEFLQQVQSLDALLVPVGGGGLISGAAIVAHAQNANIDVIGVEPEQVDDACRSLRDGIRYPATGKPTIADGLRAGIGEMNFTIVQQHVRQIVTVSEEEIVQALKLIWERLKIVIEPSAAVPFAALISSKIPQNYKTVGVILSGGNIDTVGLVDSLPKVV